MLQRTDKAFYKELKQSTGEVRFLDVAEGRAEQR